MVQILVRKGIGYDANRGEIIKKRGSIRLINITIHCELGDWQQENSEIQSESVIMWKVQHVYIPLVREGENVIDGKILECVARRSK